MRLKRRRRLSTGGWADPAVSSRGALGRPFLSMPKLPLFVLGVLLGWLATPQSAAQQTNRFITVAGHKVNPTRILARFLEPRQTVNVSTLATLKSLGLTVKNRSTLTPGAVTFELQPTVNLQSAKPNAQVEAAQLLKQIATLRDSGLFAYVEPDFVVSAFLTQPTDARYVDGTLWGLHNYGQNGGVAGADVITNPQGGNTNAWDITTGSTNVIVAVIDTGIRYTHKDLQGNMWHNPNAGNDGFGNDIYGINAINGSGDPMDDNGHGTHVSGTIGATADDNYPSVGVNWHVQLMGCKFLDASGSGFDSDAVTCIEYAVAHGARVLNNSWGGSGFTQALQDAIMAAATNGVLFVAAAGNNGTDNDLIPVFPASYGAPNEIVVAALDRKDSIAFFSDFGKKSVDVGAPGVDIYSTYGDSDTSYATLEGTSMATPHVSGVAALIYSTKFNITPTNAVSVMNEVRTRVLRSTVPVADLADTTTTGGRVNAYLALRAVPTGQLTMEVTPATNSAVLLSTNLAAFVRVSDLFDVTNATVKGYVNGTNTVFTFRNDGKPPDLVSNDGTYSTYIDLTPYTNTAFSNTLSFNLVATAPGKTGVTNTVEYYIVGRPANDNFVNAAKIPAPGAFGDNLILATNTFATMEIGEPLHAGDPTVSASLWWIWSPAASGPVLVDTAGSSFETVVAVYTGDSFSRLVQVAAATDNGSNQPVSVAFNAQAGASYRIAVAGYSTNSLGQIRLRVEPNGHLDLTPPQVTITTPADGQIFTVPQIPVTGTAYDPTPNASGVKQVLVKVNGALAASAKGTTNWSAVALLQAGQNTIEALGADYAGNRSQPVKVTVTYVVMNPPNDIFAYATPLLGDQGTSSVTNTTATKEGGEPNIAGNQGGHSVWWSFRPTTDGVLEVDTQGSTFDTLLGLFLGSEVDALTAVASNDDTTFNGQSVTWSKISQAIRANQTYHIGVDGFGGATGTVLLNYNFTPTNIVTLTLSATAGGSISPGAGAIDVVSNSTWTLIATPDPYFEFGGWQGSYDSADNPFSVVVSTNLAFHALFRPQLYSDDFESGKLTALPWTSNNNTPWFVTNQTAARGTYAARSGFIGNSQSSSLMLTANFRGGLGSFDYKVSCEDGWSFFYFIVDGVTQQQWTGNIGWVNYQFSLTPGIHTLEWRYSKGPMTRNPGLDAAFVDDVMLPLVVPLNGTSSAKLSLQRRMTGAIQLSVSGQTNQVYIIQATSSLPPQWQNISTNVADYGQIYFVDPGAGESPVRFYRAVAAPTTASP